MRRSPRTAAAAGALIAGAAMVAVGLPAGTASAQPSTAPQAVPAATHAAPRAGALPASLSPSQRATLVAGEQSHAAATASSLHLGANEKLVVKDVVKDTDGSVHTRYERTYQGLPVLGGDLIVHQNPAGAATGVDKATSAAIAVSSVTPVKSADSAKTYALTTAKAQGAAHASAAGAPRKVIWAASGTARLAWESVVGGFQDDGTPNQLHVITDAVSGAKLFQYQGIENSVGNSEYSGQVTLTTTPSGSAYNLTDGSRGGHSTYNLNHATSGKGTLFTDTDDIWGDSNPTTAQTAGVDAAFGAQETWDFYKNTFGRNGIRGDGVAAYSSTHYGSNYVNAFWDDTCFCMTYGDGSGNAHPLTALDVAGHEMSHGVTSNTAGLNYSGESGGLNEATSDIFGTGVEFYANTAADPGDYLIGEKININGNGTPLRYMDQPSKDGSSKDNWSSSLGGLDVHYSSGPANHLFYLLSEGSGAKVIGGVSYNSPTFDGLSVPGIGRDNALKLWYKSLTERFTSTTNYASARTQSLLAAADLWGAGSATYNTVANTWAAIGVGSRVTTPSGVTVTQPANQSTKVNTAASLQIQASSTNGGALTYTATGLPAGLAIGASTGLISGTPTATGSSGVTVTAKDSTGAAGSASFTWTVTSSGGTGCTAAQLLVNPGFESGATAWTQSTGVIDNSTGAPAHAGSYKAWLNGYGSTHTDTLSQSVTIPAACTSATFTYYLSITTAETTTTTAYDKLTVTAGSTTLASYSNLNKSGYVQRSVNLSAYAGQTVTLKFTGVEDASLQTSFLIDDTAVNVS